VIRQAISCDICGTEMQHTNHWFVACEQAGELRISGFGSRQRLRAGARHLCGQTCLHKLVDDFMARAISARVQPASAKKAGAQEKSPCAVSSWTGASLTSTLTHPAPAASRPFVSDTYIDGFESSARLITTADLARPALPSRPAATATILEEIPVAETPGHSPRSDRAEAWKREREREQRAAIHPAARPRRRFIA
jgi:hypothetical protein